MTVPGDGSPDGRHVTPEPVRSEAYACDVSDAAERPMLAARVNGSLYFAYRDRSVKEVFAFSVPEDGYIVGGPRLIARGDYVAAHVIVAPLGLSDSFAPFAEVVVLTVDGAVLFHQRYPFDYGGAGSESRLYGDAGGRFVHTLLETGAELALVVEGGQARAISDKWIGMADPDSNGRMVVRDYHSPSTADLQFFDLDSLTAMPSRYIDDGERASSPTTAAGGIVYLKRNPARLVFENADGTVEHALPVALAPVAHATPSWSADAGWTLFTLGGTTAEDVRYLAANLSTSRFGEQWRELTLEPPEGWSLPQDHWNPPAIDSAGRLLVPLEDGDEAQVHRTSDGRSWEAVGVALAHGGYPVEIVHAGGAIVFDGHGIPGAWLIGPQGGAGVALIRSHVPGAGASPLYFDDAISPDGSCLAYFRDGMLQVVETSDYAQSELAIASTTQSAEAAWIALP